MLKKSVLFASVILGAAAFAQTNTQTTTTQTTSTSTPAATLSDGQIVKIMKTVNECEIDAAKKAKSKAKNADVKKFADHMASDHKKNEEDFKKFANKNSIDPMDSDTDKSVKKSGKTAFDDLKKTDKDTFDKTYMDQQVMMHENALNLLNTQLIPNAKNAGLKAQLEKTREAVTAHLDAAKAIQAKL